MTLEEAMRARHSVRQYEDKPLPQEVIQRLNEEIKTCNDEGNMHIQLITNEPKAFDGFMAHYGKFSGVTNYIALIGPKRNLDEKCGYYGERLVLLAQQLGLNTCWVAMSYSKIKTAFTINPGEKLCLVISLGYGITQGVAHKSKSLKSVVEPSVPLPDWFQKGAEAALLAPTAMNQQKFTIERSGKQVFLKPGMGFYTKVDLGIVRYHFELGAGLDNFQWDSGFLSRFL